MDTKDLVVACIHYEEKNLCENKTLYVQLISAENINIDYMNINWIKNKVIVILSLIIKRTKRRKNITMISGIKRSSSSSISSFSRKHPNQH